MFLSTNFGCFFPDSIQTPSRGSLQLSRGGS